MRFSAFIILITLLSPLRAQNFFLHENGVTIVCTNAEVGETGEINGITYTKRQNTSSSSSNYLNKENFETSCTSGITNMEGQIQGTNFGGDISHWDVSSVTNMKQMFYQETSFNGDISKWDVSNVVDMSQMFDRSTFNGDISAWNTEKVTNMFRMFMMSEFNGDISSWNTSNVTNMKQMFNGARFSGGISNWNVSSVNDMSGMFYETQYFNSPLNDWDVSNVVDFTAMFAGSSVFNQYLGDWNVVSAQTMERMFENAVSFNQDLSRWCVQIIIDSPSNFALGSPLNEKLYPSWGTCPNNNFKWGNNHFTITCKDAEIGDTGTIDGVTFTKRSKDQITLENASTTCTSGITDMSTLFQNANEFNGDIKHWDVSSVETFENMFSNAYGFDHNLSAWDVSNAKSLNSMFYLATSFNGDISTWNTANVTDFSWMFYEADAFNGDISGWNTSNATTMKNMFRGSIFNNQIGSWDVSNVTTMEGMFYNADSFDQELSEWNVSNVTIMTDLFSNADNFNQDISEWDVSSVISMDGMFYRTNKFNQDLSTWDVSKVTSMSSMFSVSAFNQDISNWDVSSVTNMSGMFFGADFDQPIGNWNVSNVKLMGEMFGASNFNQSLTYWDVSNVESMYRMFDGNNKFNQPIGNWNVSSVTEMDKMFQNASSFNQDLSYWCVSKITSEPDLFSVNSQLTETHKPIWGNCPEVQGSNAIHTYVPNQTVFSIDTTFTSVYLEDVPAEGFNAFQYTLNYDPDSLNVELLDNMGTLSEGFDLGINTVNPGQIIVAGSRVDPVTENGKLSNLMISYNTGGISHITLDDVMFNEGVPAATTGDARIESTLLVCGDVTGDNGVSALDASHILRHTVRLAPQYPLEGRDFIAGDVTSNGAVTAYDAYFVLREIVGLSAGLNCSSTVYNLKEAWAPKLDWSILTKGSRIVTPLHFTEDNPEIYALELEVPNSMEVSVAGIPEDWNTLEYTNEGTQYISMYGLSPLTTTELVWNKVTGGMVEARVRINESKWQTIEQELEVNQVLPQEYTLSQNYPNPFNPSTQIQYALPEATEVTLEVFNSVGQKVMELVNGQQSAGYHTATFDASGLSSGVYLYKLTTPSFTETKKMLLIK